MSKLTLNAFPVELRPNVLALVTAEFDTWEASTSARNTAYRGCLTHRYQVRDGAEQGRVRLVALSGPIPTGAATSAIDTAQMPRVASILIENSVSRHLQSRGMMVSRGKFEHFALRRVEAPAGQLVELYSGISFSVRRPFKDQPYSFTLSAQWVARAVFSDSLLNETLQSIAAGAAVLYTPKRHALGDLEEFEQQYLGHVRQITPPDHAEVACRDNVRRSVPLVDLTLEASPATLRRYEQLVSPRRQPSGIWRRLQQLSKVLTPQGRRNPALLRDRLEDVRNVLGGFSKEQLVLPLTSYVEGAVTIGLAPIRVELS